MHGTSWRLIATALLVASCSNSTVTGSSTETTTPPSGTNPFRTGRTLVIPHAGGDGLFPENTLFAYRRSQELGGDVIDVDVRLARDRVPVAIHDSTVERTTGRRGVVAEMTSAELATLDAGWYFEREGEYPFRGQGVTISTVEEILLAFPDTLATLDLKDQRVELVQPVCDLLRRLDRIDDVYVGIDVDEQVVEFRRVCPEVATSGTSEERRIARAARETGDIDYTSAQLVSQPPFMRDGVQVVTAETLAFSHRFDTAVMTWVIDDPADMSTLLELGVDGIYTRRPDVLLELIADRQ
jgi:glycerophosphoryl diester phosphodiesterase